MSQIDKATGEILEERSYRFDAQDFARTWLTVASAASEDEELPALYRAVNVELDENGVRLTSTDSYRFWAWWVGEYHGAEEPDYEDQRRSNVTAPDADFRARDLMKYALRATKKEESPPLDLALTFGKAPTESGQFAGMERDAVTFTLSDHGTGALHESVLLRLVEADYPDLRTIYHGHKPEVTGRVAFNPVLLTKMMKAVPGSEEKPCTLVFAGRTGAALVQPFGGEGDWPLRGLIMPVRVGKSAEG